MPSCRQRNLSLPTLRSSGELQRFLFLLFLFATVSAMARPLDLEDVLRSESMGLVRFDPTGRYVVVEYLPPFASSIKVEYSYAHAKGRSKLFLIDLEQGIRLRELFPQPEGVNAWAGSFSPSGEKLSVFVLTKKGIEAGIVDLSKRRINTLGIVPDILRYKELPVWLSEEELIYPVLNAGRQPRRSILMTDSVQVIRDGHALAWFGEMATADVIYTQPEERRLPRETGGLVKINLKTGRRTSLVSGDFNYLSLSPDGRLLAATRKSDGPPFDGERKLGRSLGPNTVLSDLVLVDGQSVGEIKTLCTRCDIHISLLRWSADGQKLAYIKRPADGSWWEPEYHIYDALTGEDRRVVLPGFVPKIRDLHTTANPIAPEWVGNRLMAAYRKIPPGNESEDKSDSTESWWLLNGDDQAKNVSSKLPAIRADLIAAWPSRLIFSAADDIWAVTVDGEVRNLTDAIDTPVHQWLQGAAAEELFPSRRANEIILQTPAADGTMAYYILNANDLSPLPIGNVGEGRRLVAVSPQSGARVFLEEKNDFPRRLYIQKIDAEPKVVLDINKHIDATEPIEAIKLQRLSKDGSTLIDWVVPPTGFIANQSFPVLVYPYPGRAHGATPPVFWWTTVGLSIAPYLNAGYGVLIPSVPLGGWGDASDPMRDIAQGLAPAIDNMLTQGYGDSDRLGLIGNSFGGYAVLGVASQTDRYKAVVAQGAPVNLTSMYGTFDPKMRGIVGREGFSYFSQFLLTEAAQMRMGAPPWRDPSRYVRNSPLFSAHKINTPVMLIQGDLDSISISEGEQMFTALYRENKNAALVRYWGESHGIFSPANMRDMYKRIIAWFDRHLGNESAGIF